MDHDESKEDEIRKDGEFRIWENGIGSDYGSVIAGIYYNLSDRGTVL